MSQLPDEVVGVDGGELLLLLTLLLPVLLFALLTVTMLPLVSDADDATDAAC